MCQCDSFALACFSSRYSVEKAITGIFPSVKHISKRTTFCSMLVAAAYEQAGLSLVSSAAAEKVTPEKLSKSEFLEGVTHSVLIFDLPKVPKNGMERLERRRAKNLAR